MPKNSKNMKAKLTVMIEPQVKDQLEVYANETNRTVSDVVRTAILLILISNNEDALFFKKTEGV